MASRGQHHNGGIHQFRILVNVLGKRETIHLRHLAVQENQRKRVSCIFCDLDGLERGAASVNGGWLHTPTGQYSVEHASISEVVVDDQGGQISQLRRLKMTRSQGGALLNTE